MNIGTWIGIGLICIVYIVVLFNIFVYERLLEKSYKRFTNKFRVNQIDDTSKYKYDRKGKKVFFEILYFVMFITFTILIAYIWGIVMQRIFYYGLNNGNEYVFVVGSRLSAWFIEGLFIGILLSFIITETIAVIIFKSNYPEFNINKIFNGGFLGTVKGLKILSTVIIICSAIYTFSLMNWYIRIDEELIQSKNPIDFKGQRHSYESVKSLYKILARDSEGEEHVSYEIIFSDDVSINSKNYLIEDRILYEKIWNYISIKADKEIVVVSVSTNKFRSIKDLEKTD